MTYFASNPATAVESTFARDEYRFQNALDALYADESESEDVTEEYPDWEELATEPEDRDLVSYWDVAVATNQDRTDLDFIIDWESFGE